MRLRVAIPYFILLVLPCILLFPVLTGKVLLPANMLHDVYPWRSTDPKTLVPWNVLQFDGIAQFYPWRLLAARTWRQGYVPLWNPYEFCGTPFLANSQSAVMYPPNILFVLMPVVYAFGVSAILHLFLTGVFLYLFLRRSCRLSREAAVLGGAVWQLSTWQVSWLALPTFLDTSTWIPLALLLTDHLAERPTAGRAGALGATLGVMLLAGHLQIALYGVLLIIAYAVFSVIRRRTALVPAAGCALLVGLLMAMVASPQLLPVLELSRVSHRAGAGPTAAGYAGYVSLALPARHLVTLFLPGFFGRPGDGSYWDDPRLNFAEVACYVGVITLILALLGAIAAWRALSTARFFAVAAIVAMLLALGTPLDALLYFGIPGFGQTGSPARVLVIWTLSVAALAAFGADALLKRDEVKKGHIAAAFIANLVFLGMAYGGVAFWLSRVAPAALGKLSALGTDIRLFAGLFIAGAAVTYFYLKGSMPRIWAAGLLIALAAFDLVFVNYGYNPTVAPSEVYPPTALTQWLKSQPGGFRIMPVNRAWSLTQPPPAVLPPNAATVYELPETQGYDSLQTAQYMGFAYALNGRQSPSPPENGNIVFTFGVGSREARAAGARYLVSLSPLTGFEPPVFTDGQVNVYQDTAAQPITRMAGGETVEATQVSPTRIDIAAGGATGDVVVAQQWYPGWRVAAEGSKARLVKGPGIFCTVTGLQGRSAVAHLRYQPTTFRVGLYLACTALLALAGFAAASLVARLTPRPQAP